MRPLLLLLLLAACGRPLSDTEAQFAQQFHGPELDVTKVRVVNNPLIKLYKSSRPAPPRISCQEKILPPPKTDIITGSPGAAVLFNTITINPDIMAPDYLPNYPDAANLLATMFLAHELVHVWQWQNRELTGYHPFKAAAEHQYKPDPYLFDLKTESDFTDFGYEQQGAIAAEFVCCAALAPDSPRTERLEKLLAEVFPLETFTQNLPGTELILPWRGAELETICN